MTICGVGGQKNPIVALLRLPVTLQDNTNPNLTTTFYVDFYVAPSMSIGYRAIIGSNILCNEAYKIFQTPNSITLTAPKELLLQCSRTPMVTTTIYYFESIRTTFVKNPTTLGPFQTQKVEINERLETSNYSHIVTPYKDRIACISIFTENDRSFLVIQNLTDSEVFLTKQYPIGFAVSQKGAKEKAPLPIYALCPKKGIDSSLIFTSPDLNVHDQLDVTAVMDHIEPRGVEHDDVVRSYANSDELLDAFELDHLVPRERQVIEGLILKHRKIFTVTDEIGAIPGFEFEIPHSGKRIIDGWRPIKNEMMPAFRQYVDTLLRKGVISRVNPADVIHCTNAYLVKKLIHEKNQPPRKMPSNFFPTDFKYYRLVQDMRTINAQVGNCPNYIGNCNLVFNRLAASGSQVAIFDISSYYYHCRLSPKSKLLTAFFGATAGDFYVWETLPMGLKVSPVMASQAMAHVLRPLGNQADFYLDDVYLKTDSFDQLALALDKFFQLMQDNHLFIKPNKSHFKPIQVHFMGLLLNTRLHTVQVPQLKIKELLLLKAPRTRKQAQSVCGSLIYYSRFLKDFSDVMHPLIKLTRKPEGKFKCTPEAEQALAEVKRQLLQYVTLYYPRKRYIKYHLYSDASDIACSSTATFFDDDGQERLLGMTSKTFTQQSHSTSTYHKELTSIIHGLLHFQYFFEPAESVTCFSDNKAVIHCAVSRGSKAYVERAAQFLLTWSNLTFVHKPGRQLFADRQTRTEGQKQRVKALYQHKKPLKEFEVRHILDKIVLGENHTISNEQMRKILSQGPYSSFFQKSIKCSCICRKTVASHDFEREEDNKVAVAEIVPINQLSTHRLEQPCHSQAIQQAVTNECIVNALGLSPKQPEYKHDNTVMGALVHSIASGFLTPKHFKEIQSKDETCSAAIKAVQESGTGEVSRRVKGGGEISYFLYDNILMARDSKGHSKSFLPQVIFKAILNSYHSDGNFSTHLGPNTLCKTLEQKYYIPDMKSYVTARHSDCIYCAYTRPYQMKTRAQPNIQSTVPFSCIHVDYIPQLAEVNGYNSLLLFVCSFTGFTCAYPTKGRSKEELCYHFKYGLIANFLPPTHLRIDNELAARALQFQSILDDYAIEYMPVSAFRQQSNSQVELVVKKLKAYLAVDSLMQHTKTSLNWLEAIPRVVIAINTSALTSTGFSPYYLAFAQAPPMVLQPLKLESKYGDFALWVNGRTAKLEKAWKTVVQKRERQASLSREQYNKRCKTDNANYKEGDMCIIRALHIAQKPTGHVRYVGVYRVIAIPYQGTLELQHIGNGTKIWRHQDFVRKLDVALDAINLPSTWDEKIQTPPPLT